MSKLYFVKISVFFSALNFFFVRNYWLDFLYQGLTRQFYSSQKAFQEKCGGFCTFNRSSVKSIMPRNLQSNGEDDIGGRSLKTRFKIPLVIFFTHMPKLTIYIVVG